MLSSLCAKHQDTALSCYLLVSFFSSSPHALFLPLSSLLSHSLQPLLSTRIAVSSLCSPLSSLSLFAPHVHPQASEQRKARGVRARRSMGVGSGKCESECE
eukprot:381223-Pleurochrysis_carterae.AAC.2